MSGMKRKILIVEDDTRIAMMLLIRLQTANYETLVACNAVQAMSIAKKDCPELILLDISMPGGNGFLVAEWLRDLKETAVVPIIFMTASQKPGLREEAREYRAAGFLEKPFDAKKLLAAIQEALGSPVV
jgi:DNA-binding response OmpR family regulator